MRRARLNIKPNLGAKSRQSAEVSKPTPTVNPVTKPHETTNTPTVKQNTEPLTAETSKLGSPSALAHTDSTVNIRPNTDDRTSVKASHDLSQAEDACGDVEASGNKMAPVSRRRPLTKVKPNLPPSANARSRHHSASFDSCDSRIAGKPLTTEEEKIERKVFNSPIKSPYREDIKPQRRLDDADLSEAESDLSLTPEQTLKQKGRKKETMKSDNVEKRKPVKHIKRKVVLIDYPFDRTAITMKDLIYLNPNSNPMRRVAFVKKAIPKTQEPEEIKQPLPPEVTDKQVDDDDDERMLVPQVKIGADGNIILNEETLTVEAAHEPVSMETGDLVVEEESCTTYSSFRKRKRTKFWTPKETAKFYKALRAVGSDFEMMSNLFPNRNRAELKNKFKREERVNRELIDRAMTEPIQFDMSLFRDVSSESEEEEQERRQAERKRVRRKNKENNVAVEMKSDTDDNPENSSVKPSEKKKKKTRTKKDPENKRTRIKPKTKKTKARKVRAQSKSDEVCEDELMSEEANDEDEMMELGNEEVAPSIQEKDDCEDKEENIRTYKKTTRSGRQSKPRLRQPVEDEPVVPSVDRNENDADDEETVRTSKKTKKSAKKTKSKKKPSRKAKTESSITELVAESSTTNTVEDPLTTETVEETYEEKGSPEKETRKRTASGRGGGFVPNPGELISLDSVSNVDVSEIQPGQLVFVGGQRSDLDQQVIHVYMVSPSDTLQPVDNSSGVYHINLDNCIEIETETENEGDEYGDNVIYLGNHRIVCTPQKQHELPQQEQEAVSVVTEEVEGEDAAGEVEEDEGDSDVINISDDEIHISDDEINQIA